MREVPGSNPGRARQLFAQDGYGSEHALGVQLPGPGPSYFGAERVGRMYDFSARLDKRRFHGVMVSTLDSESSDPSSNLGGTSLFCRF